MNRKRSVGRPDRVSAAMAALGPGRVVTARPAARASRTSLYPGSEMSGVPASDSSATDSAAIRSISRARSVSLLWS